MSGKDTKYKVKRFEGPLTLLEVGVRRAHRLLVYHNSHWYAIDQNSHWYARATQAAAHIPDLTPGSQA